MTNKESNQVRLKRLGIDTQYEYILFVRKDSFICKSEGFGPHVRVQVTLNEKSIITTLNIVCSDILKNEEVSLSEKAWEHLGAMEGDYIHVAHIRHFTSFKYVRSKIYNHDISAKGFHDIVRDIVLGKYSNIQLSSFVTACAGENLKLSEIIDLTKAMVDVGQKIKWQSNFIANKHSVGGLPGNRTSPIIVAIVAAAGLTIPKTSSHAITSPAGTADTVGTMTTVELSLKKMHEVVDKEGGCLAWGGGFNLSPADDIIIRVERVLDLDPEGQMIASVLSKNIAVGATNLLLDIPVGPSAKVRTDEMFLKIKNYFITVGDALGLNVIVAKTDGNQPVGIGLGPALEAKDVLAVLQNSSHAPLDLQQKAIMLAGKLLELGNKAPPEQGEILATNLLRNGTALKKFLAICEAQGGFREPTTAKYIYNIVAPHKGIVTSIDNRNLATVAKLAGAPHDPAAGIEFLIKLGANVNKGQVLYRIHAEYKGELDYALNYARSVPNIIKISDEAHE